MRRPPIVPFRGPPASMFSLRAYRREEQRGPLHAPGLHGHRFFTLNAFDGGSGSLRGPRGVIEVAAGTLGLELPCELYDASGLARMRGWVVEFTDELLEGLELARTFSTWGGFGARPWGTPLFAEVPPRARKDLTGRLERMADELSSQRPGYRDAARALLHLILVDLSRLLPGEAQPPRLQPLVHEALAVIDRRHAEPISLADVAGAVGRSPSHLTSAMRAQTGMTVLEWITERRMAEARRRLRETDEDVSIIAERVGYLDASYFTRLFRRAHGMAPRAFRDAIDKSS